jgi:hypothetical protein
MALRPIHPHSPYRYFFPFSIAGIILGLGQFLFQYSGHGIVWHRELMITLFLLPAAAGFIYTAAPRFLNAMPTRAWEVRLLMILFTFLFATYFLDSMTWFLVGKWCAITTVFVFFVFRWWNRRANNPYWPPFIYTSLFTGWTASGIQCFAVWTSLPAWLTTLAGHLYYDAMFWILLFGIGLKFFPMLTGAVPPVYRNERFSLISKKAFESPTLWFVVAFLALGSFILQDLFSPISGLTLRALLLLFMAYHGWALLEKAQRGGYTTFVLRLFLGSIVAGHLVFIFFPAQLVHLYHLVFVCGFLSLTLAVETRVMLSHEQLDLAYEQNSGWLLTAYGSFFVAMLFRLTAVLIPLQYGLMLHLASALALAGTLIMLFRVIQMLKLKYKTA